MTLQNLFTLIEAYNKLSPLAQRELRHLAKGIGTIEDMTLAALSTIAEQFLNPAYDLTYDMNDDLSTELGDLLDSINAILDRR